MEFKEGMKVRHKYRPDRYGILLRPLFSGTGDNYWELDIYYNNGEIFREGNWREDNLVPLEMDNNKQASVLLDKER